MATTLHVSTWPSVIRCPACRTGTVSCAGTCTHCAATYAVYDGILDIRAPAGKIALTANERFILDHPDWDFATLLRELFRRYTDALVDYYVAYHLDTTRGARMGHLFRTACSHIETDGIVLDIGCGSGTLFETERQFYRWVIGIDHSLEQLLCARRRLGSGTTDNIILICADADDLPFFSESLDALWTLNTLEHLLDMASFLSEAARVLKPGRLFIGDSRNRYDLLFPEPHVRLRFVGFLPRWLQGLYIALRRGSQPAILYLRGTRLRSLRELHTFMRPFFSHVDICLPDIAAYGASKRIGRILTSIVKIPVLGTLIRFTFPSYLVVGQK